jgi:amino acid transporter
MLFDLHLYTNNGTRLIFETGLPDGGFFGKISIRTSTPLRAIWLSTIVGILPVLLDLASPIASNAVFSLTAIALDLSYVIPIFCRRVFHSHPDVMFKPGPFFMGYGWLGWACNTICIAWTLFVCVIFALPTNFPVTVANMNYSSVR